MICGLVVLADVREVPDRVVAVPHLAHDRLVAGDDLAHLGFDLLEIVGRERLVAREVVVEAVFDGRTDGDLRAGIERLHRLGHDMRRIVADQLQHLVRLAGDDLDRRVVLDHCRDIADLAVDLDRDRGLGQPRPDRGGDVRARHRPVESTNAPVGERDGQFAHGYVWIARRRHGS